VALTDEAIEKIKSMIVSGTLRAGDRLPKEADLAAELGLSRSSLREAVKALSLVNILDVRRGDGTYVTSLQPPLLLEALSFIVDFHRDGTVLEFLQVRRILEPAAAAMAAERIGEEEIEGLGRLLDSLGPRPWKTWSPTTWSSTGGFRPAPGIRCSARCWSRCPGRRSGPGSGVA
jgi:GntR family transcriptional repressor for pyruvate dehydrogenase complex